ncbi:MAG: PucR family transcriptional regulator [Clostridiaceae bacterium]|nr:PucR family transcriptional regulator [Clostridiaceae bacterium]
MSVTVKKLYKNSTFLYNMKLIAGHNGLNNLVQWVHIIEDDSVISFLHGNELVFTAGILNKKKDWLLNFAVKLKEVNASAFVVNLGPHTKEIDNNVIEFCNKENLPLFTIPWETRMVDMTRDFCNRILNDEQMENDLSKTIKNIVFNVGDLETQIMQLERYGCNRDSMLCFISITIGNLGGASFDDYQHEIQMIAERIAKSIHELYIYFLYQDSLILALINYTDAEIDAFVKEFFESANIKLKQFNIHMGISPNKPGLNTLNKSFEKATSAMKMACNLKEKYLYYDKLGIYKILYATSDKEVLRSFYNDTIGKLVAYDRQNNTKFTELLRIYLENNGSVQLVSEKLYVHRNTVLNHLKKIESIVGINPLELEGRVNLYMGFYIKDIL